MPKPRRHTNKHQALYDSPAWKALRLATRKRDGYRCVICKADVSGSGQARSDHIISVDERPDLALVPSNIRTLCTSCDNQAHREKPKGTGAKREARFVIRGCNPDGTPIDPVHPWLNGR